MVTEKSRDYIDTEIRQEGLVLKREEEYIYMFRTRMIPLGNGKGTHSALLR
jgi:hypothetical protein